MTRVTLAYLGDLTRPPTIPVENHRWILSPLPTMASLGDYPSFLDFLDEKFLGT